MDKIDIQRIAATYYDALCDALTFDEIAEIKRRNREDYKGTSSCAAHDFCDANVYLFAAYEDHLGGECVLTDDVFAILDQVQAYAHDTFLS
jgi:hypothetical protein